MRKCPFCGEEYRENEAVCPHCGSDVTRHESQTDRFIRILIKCIVNGVIFLFILPAALFFFSNYVKLCVQRGMPFETFLRNFPEFSIRPVIGVYAEIKDWIVAFIETLKK